MNQLSIFFASIFILGTFFALSAQNSPLEWIVPLKEGISVAGKPSEAGIGYKQNGKIKFANTGAGARELPYDSISYLNADVWMVWKERFQGVYSASKGEMLPPVYQHVYPGEDGGWAYTVRKYGMNAVVDDANKLVLPWREWEYIGLNPLSDTILEYIDKKGYNFTNMGYVTRTGTKIPLEQKEQYLNGVINRLAADKYVFYQNTGGKMLRDTFSAATEFTEDIAVVQKGGLYGYLRRNGSWLIAPRFQAATPFNPAGLAAAKEKGRFGILKMDNTWAVQPRFEDLKILAPGLFQFSEGLKTGLIDIKGKILLPPATYAPILASGTESFGVKVADTIQIYNYEGKLLPISGATGYEGNGNYFQVKQQKTSDKGRKSEVSGIAKGSDGAWLVPPVFGGRVVFSKYFIAIEAKTTTTETVAGVKIEPGQWGKYLVFNRNGKLLSPVPLAIPYNIGSEPFISFTLDKKMGLLSAEGNVTPADYDQILSLGNGWISLKKEKMIGFAKWKSGM